MTSPSVEHVYVSEDGLNGKSREALLLTRRLLEEEGGNALIGLALEEVLASADRRTLLDGRKEQHHFFFGSSSLVREGDGFGSVDHPYGALVYAEGSGLQDDGAFSVVRMAKWMRRGDAEIGKSLGEETSLEVVIRAALHDTASKGPSWGIPVGRLTRVETFAEPAPGYVYGHVKELASLDRLRVPERMRGALKFMMQAWHRSELEHGGEAVFADVQDALQDQNF